jgi:hypothetical protein
VRGREACAGALVINAVDLKQVCSNCFLLNSGDYIISIILLLE